MFKIKLAAGLLVFALAATPALAHREYSKQHDHSAVPQHSHSVSKKHWDSRRYNDKYWRRDKPSQRNYQRHHGRHYLQHDRHYHSDSNSKPGWRAHDKHRGNKYRHKDRRFYEESKKYRNNKQQPKRFYKHPG